ncbi:MAG TPA: hypothetical protein ENN45_00790 [Bacteroidetes bacterium]|nr:hypothetical protein [Bacteroidota bacterium]
MAIFYAHKSNNDAFEKFLNCLVEANQVWAKNAQLLIFSVGAKNYKFNSKPNNYYMHDVGAANAYLVLQVAELRFQAHQMAGFDIVKTISTFNIDSENYSPITFIAVGYQGDAESLPENLRNAELQPRTRKENNLFITKIT